MFFGTTGNSSSISSSSNIGTPFGTNTSSTGGFLQQQQPSLSSSFPSFSTTTQSQQQQQSQPSFMNFGSAGSGNFGFGQQQQQPSQQQQQQQITTTTPNPFGTIQPQPQPSSSSMFGISPNIASSTTTTTTTPFHITNGFTTTTSPFHTNSNNTNQQQQQHQQPASSSLFTPFGTTSSSSSSSLSFPSQQQQQQQTPHPFGVSSSSTTTIMSSPFGTITTAPSSSSSSSTIFSTPAAVPQPPPPALPSTNPFGMIPSSSSTTATNVSSLSQQQQQLAFGVSSNVVVNNQNHNTPFNNIGGTIQQQHNTTTSFPTTPFGIPTQQQQQRTTFSTSPTVPNTPFHTTTTTNNNNNNHHNPFSIIPSTNSADGMSDDDITNDNNNNYSFIQQQQQSASTSLDTQKVNELATLQAKIAEKKKKIQEKKLLAAAAAAAANTNTTTFLESSDTNPTSTSTTSQLRAEATSFIPSMMSSSTSTVATTTDSNSIDISTVAQKNAIRFAESTSDTTTKSQLPSDLQDPESIEAIVAQTALRNMGSTTGGQQHLDNAISLVGTCMYMCPDEELLRREREGDIQLLERPDIHIHPISWTLRDTMVKRFRRSAADYKLDVPEWIRPPDILERVCGYLEEWVMERDRQGPDPRYKNVPSPPPLDVYQFVWDRTRMVRKDFILQNFVGTGGLVDARAVRCHERIARWHCLCEHQLSHMNEYVLNQSQQNVQELGQTMKTLNQFYDDSMGRALREVPDESGMETRTNFTGFNHGCNEESVQGQSPVDYDGTPLISNTTNVTSRLIGVHAVSSSHRGTAEPEMRGLYILLTIDNDGGLEVNKYASRLYEERPEVYHTEPVQLALSIYKAKMDKNYAKFFSILRSPSTPYLFACLMFKHVALMRKYAIYLMSKTYGGKGKDGTNLYDTYPLNELTTLLCFEDDDETRSACKHYNITILTEKSGIEVISWRTSSFKEIKDPEKGTVIQLRPRKMTKTIEGKLNGATRLAICRGELSGPSSHLSSAAVQLSLSRSAQSDSKGLTSQQRNENQRLIVEKENEERARRSQREAMERQKQHELARIAENEKKQKQEEEMKRQMKLAEEEERKVQIRIENERLEREKRETQLRLEQETQQRMKDEMLAREEAERQRKLELQRQELIRKQQEIQAREEAERIKRREEELLQQRRAEQERLQREREAEAKRQVEEQRKKEFLMAQELQRQQREAEKLRLVQEKQRRLDAARKIAVWTWRITRTQNVRNNVKINEAISSLRSTFSARKFSSLNIRQPEKLSWIYDDYADRLGESLVNASISLCQSMLNQSVANKICTNFDQSMSRVTTTSILLKIAIIFPLTDNIREQQVCNMIRVWLQSRLTFDNVIVCQGQSHSVHLVFVDTVSVQQRQSVCDAAIFVIPPPWADDVNNRLEEFESMTAMLDNDVPRVGIALFYLCGKELLHKKCNDISTILSGDANKIHIAMNRCSRTDSLEESLIDCLDSMAGLFTHENAMIIERCSISRIFFRCVSDLLWRDKLEKREDIVLHVHEIMASVINELSNAKAQMNRRGIIWPSSEFGIITSTGSFVPNYFGANENLPMDWASTLHDSTIEEGLLSYTNALNDRFSSAIENFITDAPYHVRSSCQYLLDRQEIKRCLQTALHWRMTMDESLSNCTYVYLPHGLLDSAIDRVITTYFERDRTTNKRIYSLPSKTYFDESVSLNSEALSHQLIPTNETSIPSLNSSGKRSTHNNPRTEEDFKDENYDDSNVPPPVSSEKKRRRIEPDNKAYRNVSKVVSESLTYTKKLESLLNGSTTLDLMIGNGRSFLSTALTDAPPLITEIDEMNNIRRSKC